jgi:Ca2+-binding EF-hand superfamily protein
MSSAAIHRAGLGHAGSIGNLTFADATSVAASDVGKVQTDPIKDELVVRIARMLKRRDMSMQDLYKMFDKDENGILDAQEFGNVVNSFLPGSTDVQITALYRKFDQNLSGSIDLEEFLRAIDGAWGDHHNDYVEELVDRIRNFVFSRRVRVSELFKDFDRFRTGRCSTAQFHKALKNFQLKPPMTSGEIHMLIDHFTMHDAQPPLIVNYKVFCDQVDGIFAAPPKVAKADAKPSECMESVGTLRELGCFHHNEVPDMDELHHVLHRVAVLCKTKGYVWDALFRDFVTCPTTVNPMQQVTVSQFRRNFPFRGELGEHAVNLLIKRYGTDFVNGSPVRVNFQALHNDVSEAGKESEYESAKAVGRTRRKCSWTNDSLLAFERLAARVIQRRVRLEDYFRDFDNLRKGVCTLGHLKTVLGMLNLAQDLTAKDFGELGQMYINAGGKFRYVDFCKDVNSGFGKKPLFAHPTAVVKMVDASTTAHARFNQLKLAPEDQRHFDLLEAKVRTWVINERIQMRPFFYDMDTYNKGVVKRPQFKRVLCMVNLKVNDNEAELLADGYCNRGNVDEVDYNRFLKAVDPFTPDQQLANDQYNAIDQDVSHCKQYFDDNGTIIPSPKKSWSIAMTGAEWLLRSGSGSGSRPKSAAAVMSKASSAPRLFQGSPTQPSLQRPASAVLNPRTSQSQAAQGQRPSSATNPKLGARFPRILSEN